MRPALIAVLVQLTGAVVAAPVPKALKKPPRQPDGAWVLVECVRDGTDDVTADWPRDWVIEGEHVHPNARVEPAHGEKGPPNLSTPDPARPHVREWGGCPAVFELAAGGDTLKVYAAVDGREVLTECRPQAGVKVFVFRRAGE
jgi:hypothetical protein